MTAGVQGKNIRKSKPLRDIGRAFGGAIIFSLSMLMTQELWQFGGSMNLFRLALLIVLGFPMLVELSHQIGFERTGGFGDDVIDALFALMVGALTTVVLLVGFNSFGKGASIDEIVGKTAIQIVPAAMGALLGRSQFGRRPDDDVEEKQESYSGELFLMGVGALYLGFNVAPTQEIALIANRLAPWHALMLVGLSLSAMYGFVFAVNFRGGRELGEATPWWSAFVRLTVPGYVLALAISLYLLWTFERLDAVSLSEGVITVIVLGLPCSIGAAAARLIL